MKRRALLSVFNKTGILELAKEFVRNDIEIISTGGTYKALEEEGISVTPISDITQFPEILGGRVKTLHPLIHGGILAVRDEKKHEEETRKHGIQPIDFVVVNLYPFLETTAKENATEHEVLENIDIGGPTLIRAAAKNYRDVTVLVDPMDYMNIVMELKKGEIEYKTRQYLAEKAFIHTASYDSAISTYFHQFNDNTFPEEITLTYKREHVLRYGENPHQKAAFYIDAKEDKVNNPIGRKLHGKDLSYNNISDAHTALECIREFSQPTAVAVKHMNPCGVGISSTIEEAFKKCCEGDPVSIFGGIVAFNRVVTLPLAKALKGIFLEVILAPKFTTEALTVLKEKKNVRLLQTEGAYRSEGGYCIRSVNGGALIQEKNTVAENKLDYLVVTKRKPSNEEWDNLLFAWKVVKHVKSNAIVLANDLSTIGIGAGQMNRVGAARIAIEQAGEKVNNAVLASDAFFPMPDTVEMASRAGVSAIIQPGGSIRDEDSIEEANKHGIAMVCTGIRHFNH